MASASTSGAGAASAPGPAPLSTEDRLRASAEELIQSANQSFSSYYSYGPPGAHPAPPPIYHPQHVYMPPPPGLGHPPPLHPHQYPHHPHPLPPPPPAPIIISDDIVSGTKRRGALLSPVRRFFCLLVTFDLLFTSLLWIITVIVTGRDLRPAVAQQVLEYTIHDSMFDCVMSAACRFVICFLLYALLDLNWWWPIAVTTIGTSAFIVAKVFEYQWTKFGPITFDVMLVLLTFILSWSELWFLDFRVLPLEFKAKEIAARLAENDAGAGGDGAGDERRPLLFSSSAAQQQIDRYLYERSLYDGSVANFYSPLESPADSGDELEEDTCVTIPKKFKRKTPLTAKESEYRQLGEEAMHNAWRILNSDDWKLEKTAENGDTVHTKMVKNKKLFKLTGVVDIPAKLLLEELFYQLESVPSWNPTLTECRIIQAIDSHTDVSYQVCAEAAGGVVSTRDFVNLRHWGVVDGVYVSSGVSVKHPAMPPQAKRVRGENGPGCWAMVPLADQPDRCVFQWLLDTDLKGWIPQYIIDSALSGAQFDYIKYIRQYALQLHERGRVAEHVRTQREVRESRESREREQQLTASSSNGTTTA